MYIVTWWVAMYNPSSKNLCCPEDDILPWGKNKGKSKGVKQRNSK